MIPNRLSVLAKHPAYLFLGSVLIFFFINVLVRLPLYFSDNFWFDGDEAIIGIMAQDYLKTGHLPFFFYGQQYGFASIETFFAAFFIQLMGTKVLALKMAGILIHSLALAFLALTFQAKKIPWKTQLFLLSVIILLPTFYLWASQMRSSALLLACIIFYLTETRTANRYTLALVFVFSILLLEAQAMFYFFAAALIAIWIWNSTQKWWKLLLFFGLQALGMFWLNFISTDGGVTHEVRIEYGSNLLSDFLTQLSGILPGFNGFHYFTVDIAAPLWYDILSGLLMVFLLSAFFFTLWKKGKTQKSLLVFYLGGLLVFLLFLSGFQAYGPRYWINFFGGTMLVFLHLILHRKEGLRIRNWIWAIPVLLCGTMIVGSQMKVHFATDDISEERAFQKLENAVFEAKCSALFTTDPYLQWQWNFLHGEKVPCSSFYDHDRSTYFLKKVNKVYRKSPASVGCIGLYGIFLQIDFQKGFNEERVQVGKKYYFLKGMKADYYDQARETLGLSN